MTGDGRSGWEDPRPPLADSAMATRCSPVHVAPGGATWRSVAARASAVREGIAVSTAGEGRGRHPHAGRSELRQVEPRLLERARLPRRSSGCPATADSSCPEPTLVAAPRADDDRPPGHVPGADPMTIDDGVSVSRRCSRGAQRRLRLQFQRQHRLPCQPERRSTPRLHHQPWRRVTTSSRSTRSGR